MEFIDKSKNKKVFDRITASKKLIHWSLIKPKYPPEVYEQCGEKQPLPKPLSRIVLYRSGASRIIRQPDSPPPINELKRHKQDITSFSSSARKRYYDYLNSLCLDKFPAVYNINLTIQDELENFVTPDILKAFTKDFLRFEIIKKLRYDYVYKREYTEKAVPHYHLIVYGTKALYHTKDERIEKARDLGLAWTTYIFNNLGFSPAVGIDDYLTQCYKDMCTNSCFIKKPKDLKMFAHYMAYYFTKDKEYQNIIPPKYYGLKMWGYGRQIYGDQKQDPIFIPITQEIYDRLYIDIKNEHEKKKKKDCDKAGNKCEACPYIYKNRLPHCTLYKKNGFFLDKPMEKLLQLKNEIKNLKEFNENAY